MATTLRAAVMLSALVGLPAAWIYYGPLPPQAQRVVDRLVAVAKVAVPSASQTEAARPRRTFAPADPAPSWPANVEAEHQPAFEPPVEPILPVAAAGVAEPRALSFAERVEPLLARLRQLGVAEYALERWGDGGQLYRFRCEMPIAASAELTQQFEAVAADPQSTVEQVVAEIAIWQLAQQGGGM
jgi:hypothetical protein